MKRLRIGRFAIGFAALAALALPAAAATETVLYSFPDPGTGYPLGTLTFDNGSLYGTGSGDEKAADGQVFKLTNSGGAWKETTLLTFDGSNGSTPFTGPIRGPDGVFYGTTAYGDAYNGGNVYALSKKGGKWVNSTIWAFGGTAGDGMQPECDLVMDKSGNLFGTTFNGGTYNVGTVFELSKVNGAWTETVLRSFEGKNGGGWFPYAGLLMAGPDTFYGTTFYGGDRGGDGTVFKLFKSGGVWKEKVIYSFGGSDGYEPWGTLIRDKNGALYGTTRNGGVSGGYSDVGTVFMLSRSGGVWKEQVLHNFGADGDGANPLAGLTWGPSGSLYGTTSNGGDPGSGTVFELTQSGGVWTETILHSFGNNNGDGGFLQGGVTLDENGALYGTT
ncbi:MAG TPA: choice-of-anchor tandem repeat GloVer-containing protein, partial [Rhizomicrobium sp.]